MAERRSMAEALGSLEPETLGFIQGTGGSTSLQRRQANPVETAEQTVDGTTRSAAVAKRRMQTRTTTPIEVPESWKVPVTIKLKYVTAQALKRAYLEQKLRHARPDTQQEIVEAAVQSWLRHNGYFTD